jgi:hypothetical protein
MTVVAEVIVTAIVAAVFVPMTVAAVEHSVIKLAVMVELMTVSEMAVTVMTVVVTIMSVAVAIMIVVGAAVAVMTVVRSSNNGVFYTVAKNSRLGEKKKNLRLCFEFRCDSTGFPTSITTLQTFALFLAKQQKKLA